MEPMVEHATLGPSDFTVQESWNGLIRRLESLMMNNSLIREKKSLRPLSLAEIFQNRIRQLVMRIICAENRRKKSPAY